MAEEAVIEQEELQLDAPAAESPDDPLKAFEEFLSGAAAPATEQPLADDDAAGEPDAVDEEAAEEEPSPEESTDQPPVAEGPSFVMKQVALNAGVDQRWVNVAKDDAQLQQFIELAGRREEEPQTPAEPEKDELELRVDLPEDEYGPDDPLRKAFAAMQETLNKQRQEYKRNIAALAAFANQRIQAEEQQEYQKLYSPFDETLDSYASPVLGKSGSLTPAQNAVREAVAQKYLGLGATAGMSADVLSEYTQYALQATRKDVYQQHQKQQQASARQQKKVLGGSPSKPSPQTKHIDDIVDAWQRGLAAGQLPDEL